MKRKIYLSIITLLIIFPISVNAQTLKLTDTKVNNIEPNNDYRIIFNKYDNNGKVNGFVVIGTYTNSKTTSSELTMFKMYNKKNELQKTYLKDDIIENNTLPTVTNPIYFNSFNENIPQLDMTPKGGADTAIVMLDETDIAVTESTPQYKWKAQFGGNGYDLLFLAIKDFDNNKHDGYIFVGLTTSTDLFGLNAGYIAVKYDLNGKLIWQKNIDLFGLAILASYDKSGKVDGIITTENGYLQKCYFDQTTAFEARKTEGVLYDLTYSRDNAGKVNGYIATGTTCGSVARRETDVQKRFLEPITKNVNNKLLTAKVELLDGKFCYPTITKYDLDGNQLEEKILEQLKESEFLRIKEIKNINEKYDGYIILGSTPKENSNYNTNGLFVELDSNLNEEQLLMYEGGAYHNELLGIEESFDEEGNFNGYNVVGVHSCYTLEQSSKNKIGKIQPLTSTDNEKILCNGTDAGVLLKYTYPKFPITKTEEKGGTIIVDEEAPAGSVVKLRIIPKEGYYVEKVIVLDEKGNEIEVKDNSFIMPEGKVRISAVFKRIINPETLSTIVIITIITVMIGIGTITTLKKKKQAKIDL